ncbi:MAG: right-handed parallel beta-helix repeat-containing protein, partial [Kiritimatiellae bacterium]|nr:right-handed parallel beta-helix repeat-containing protein [Kiritimatiellia bacterium]
MVLATDTNVVGQSPTNFVYRPSPLVYYVNDLSTNGDVYTTAVGDPVNNGYQTNSPLDSVAAVLERYQLTPGDSLLIDAGEYELSKAIEWTSLNAGTAAEPVTIQGSTNPAAPTVFVAADNMNEPAFAFIPTHDVVLRHVGLLGFTNGVSIIKDNNRITLEHLDVQGAWGAAVSVQQAQNTILRHVLMRDGDGVGLAVSQCPITLDSCVVWSNKSHAIFMGPSTTLSMTNSILGATGFGQYCYYSATNVTVKADYNNLFLADAAQIASINGVQYERLPQWMTAKSTDIHSLSTDPWFHDAANGDFHPRSIYGRFEVRDGALVETKDVHEEGLPDVSPMIDMGHTNKTWEVEPAPNGGRRNIGLFGGTPEASKSDTNAWVMAVTAMSGGLLNGTFFLSWGYGGDLDTNALVRLEYSPFNGEGEWTFISTAKLSSGAYYWVSDSQNPAGGEKWMTSPEARWRIVVADSTNVWDTTELPFGLRNNPFKYYLNDDSLERDLWCTKPGSDENSGFWTNAPKATLQSLLENIDVEPTDEIYMDTGVYLMADTNRPVAWLVSDGGDAGQPVKWVGSTNGAVMKISQNFAGGRIFESAADYVTASNIGFQVATRNSHGVRFSGTGLQLSGMSFSNATLSLNSTASSYSDISVDGGSVSRSGLSNRVSRLESKRAPLTLVGTNAMLQNSVV